MKNVLFIGATGRMGPGLIEEYKKKYKKFYNLVVGYHNKKPDYNLELRKIDISNIEVLKKAMEGIDVVINFAANSNQDVDFKEIYEPNIIGAYNVFESARISGVKRVIFSSSVHAIKGYPLEYEVNHQDIPKPINFYGASKVFGEALCNVYSHNYGISCLAIRVGAYTSNDQMKVVCYARDFYHYVVTQRDMMQLVHKCIIAPDDVKFGILSGISDNKHKSMDLDFTRKRVGYNPEDDAFEICEEIKMEEKTKNILDGSKKDLEKSWAEYLYEKIKNVLSKKSSVVLGIVGGRSVQGILENLSKKNLDWNKI